MFGFFKKKSKYDKLNEEYQKVLKEAFELSKIDRSKSDAKYVEAEKILTKMGH